MPLRPGSAQPSVPGRRPGTGWPAGSRRPPAGPARPPRPGSQARPPRQARPAWTRRPLRRTSSIRRLNAILLSIAFAISLIVGRLIQLQGVDSARYRYLSHKEKVRTAKVPAVRGEIVSSNGTVLAMTVRTDLVWADPAQMKSVPLADIAGQLSGPLRMSPAAILHLLRKPSSPQYVQLKKSVIASTADAISKLAVPGIYLTPTYLPAFPGGALAAPLLGFIDTNPSTDVMTGEAGLEQAYNPLLAGRAGTVAFQREGDEQPIPGTESIVKPSVPAGNLRLTIQADIQWEAEHECAVQVAATHARNCTVVVMDPSTGRILALAQYPSFDADRPVTSLRATNDIAVSDVFAPGSTAKVITAAAAFADAGQTPLTSYLVPDALHWRGAWYRDAEVHKTQRYTIAGIIAHSLNDGMVQVAAHVTPAEQYAMFRAFGLGAPSGLSLPGESSGLLLPPSQWTGGNRNERYQLSFGQSIGVTAVQMASVYATIANGGVRVTPSVVAGHTTSSGKYVPAPRPSSRRVISAKVAGELMESLEQVPIVYNEAGEPWGIIRGYTVAAKTGTAQEPGNTYGSSFIGIAPASGSGLVVAVNLQDPRKGSNFGIDVAGPVFNAVMKFALATMKIPPDRGHVPYVPLTVP